MGWSSPGGRWEGSGRTGFGLVATMLAAVACSPAAAPSIAATPSVQPTAEPTGPVPTATYNPGTSDDPVAGDPVAEVDAICRVSGFRDPGQLTVSNIMGDLVTIVYTDPEGDSICQYTPRYGDTGVIQGPFEHYADMLSAETPMVRDPNMSYVGEIGTYVWGAVGPEVASVVIELGPDGSQMEATIVDGYFLAVVGPDVPCCLYTAVAFDAAGGELARSE